MKVVDRYLLKQCTAHFLFGVVLFVAIWSAADLLFDLARLWLQARISLAEAIRVFFWSLPSFLIYVLPIATLLATILTISQLAQASEIIALRASGVSYTRILLPFILFSIWVCGATIVIQETLIPASSEQLEKLLGKATSLTMFSENTFFKDTTPEGYERIFYVKRIDPDKALLHQVVVQEYDATGLKRIINAEQAYYQEEEWIFQNGVAYQIGEGGEVKGVVTFATEEINAGQSFEESLAAQTKPEEMSFNQLRTYINREKRRGQQTAKLEVMLWHKTAIPFACVVFAFIGVPLGISSPRSGRALGFGVSVLIVFGYYVLLSLAGTLAEGGAFSPVVGAWLSNLVGLAVGVFILVYRERSS
ncbi:MAG: lipopolysaccharide export system permease protein [Candidatus Atribacteria bacterium]|nr:lipopolysaccharide export system permease protein [Candidatus Atribacteria bacterium]